jgi:uncharacterized protein YjiS (DUF1127 family)
MAIRTQFDFTVVSRSASHRMPVNARVRRLTAWVRAAIARWHERRILEELDERMLRDIGISRSEAQVEARKPAWRR